MSLVNGIRREAVEITYDQENTKAAPSRYILVRFDGYTRLNWSGEEIYVCACCTRADYAVELGQ